MSAQEDDMMNDGWPPPGFWCDPATGKQWRATEAELREAARLLAKHRDLARPRIHHHEATPARAGGKEHDMTIEDRRRQARLDRQTRVVEHARRLIAKIKAEATRGTPVHPAGHPDCPWTLTGGGYPAEYAALANALAELDRLDRGGPVYDSNGYIPYVDENGREYYSRASAIAAAQTRRRAEK